MAQEIITLENLAAEVAKLRGELATWKALAIKQDRLSTAQMLAVNSGATAGKIAQIATNTSDIAALQQIASSAFRVVKVAQLPASGEPYIMYLVPQTDGETLNYCNEYLWIDNAWELVGTTGAMANNGELQIIVNGVTVGTFTANQATDSTASITVPTDTSQLTNGAGYVDATALATALASKQDSLSLTQLAAVNSGITSTDVAQIGANTTAIAGKQDALTTSQLAAVNSGITSSLVTQIGTNQSDITTLNTALGQSLTPSADDTYSLGGASFRYASVYAVTFTGDLTGTASKAIADEDGTSIKTGYGKLAGNNTWTGVNTFTQNIQYRLDINGEQGNLSGTKNYVFLNEISTDDKSFSYDQISVAAGFTQLARYVRVYDSTGTQIQSDATLYRLNSNGTSFFAPRTSSAADLGTSTNKWKTLNGINPGALSLPSQTGYVTIDTTNWDLTGNISSPNWYMPTVDGWLCVIALAGTMTDAWLDVWENSLWGQSVSQSPTGELFCMIPVRANLNVRIRVKASSIYDARLFVASGNV